MGPRSLALSQNPRLEHLLVSNRRAGQDLVVRRGFLSTLNPILDQDQSPGQGQGGILIDVTVAPDPILTLIEDDLEAGHIHQNIGVEGAAVILQCLTGEDIQAAGQIQILTPVLECLASVYIPQREIFVKYFLDMDH